MKERYLITGINGFVGSHVAELLVSMGKDVVGMVHQGTKITNIDHLSGKLTIFESDLLEKEHLQNSIDKVKPSVIINFAGQSSNSLSFKEPELTYKVNYLGSLNILEAVRVGSHKTKVLLIGSSEEYGIVDPEKVPVDETCPLNPQNPYASSKVASETLGYAYYRDFGIDTIMIRSFNQEGPRRQEGFALSSFAKQIVAIERGESNPVIFVGNLDVKRDLTDVRDAARGYVLLAEKGKSGEVYNMCSGMATNMNDALKTMVGLSTVREIKISIDPSRVRKSGNPIFYGNCNKLKKATGWQPEIPIKDTLRDMLDYWRNN